MNTDFVIDVCLSITCLVLYVIAGVTDLRKRIIPDYVPLLLLLIGLVRIIIFYQPYLLFLSSVGLVVPSIIILIGHKKGGKVGGGDLKIVAASGFLFGIIDLCFILLVALISGGVYYAVKRASIIPLGAFLAIGVVFYYLVYFITGAFGVDVLSLPLPTTIVS